MENVGGEEKGSAGGGLQVDKYGFISLCDAEGTYFYSCIRVLQRKRTYT